MFYHTIFIYFAKRRETITTMAAGGRPVYEAEDLVNDRLLSYISKWILYHELGALARDLGISQADFSRIAVPTSTPAEQIFKVSMV